MSVAAGIIELLVGANVGVLAPSTLGAWPIYEGQFPETQEQCIVVRDTGGKPPEVKIAINYPACQVLVRSDTAGYDAARTKIHDVFVALHAIDASGTSFPSLTSCLSSSEPNFLGYDANKRPVWSANFNCIVSLASEGYRNL